jgi:tetraprenyl-beta-curcumene synthase
MTRSDPAPLTPGQLRAVASGAARELTWGLWQVRREVARWRGRALAIGDATARHDALVAEATKRPLTNGAAFFGTLTPRRNPGLLRLLVAFQTLANYLDMVSERDARERGTRPGAWMELMSYAVDLEREWPPSRPLPSPADHGFVDTLVTTCRAECARLPRYAAARTVLALEVRRSAALDLEHDPKAGRRAATLRRFAASEYRGRHEMAWWELTAGASSLLTAIVIMALAADERTTTDEVHRAADAYRWVATCSALLDNFIDDADDNLNHSHNYLELYVSRREAVDRLGELIDRSLREVAALRRRDRHVLIVAAMAAMFLSSDNLGSPSLRGPARALTACGGTLTRALLPALKAWRATHRRRSG